MTRYQSFSRSLGCAALLLAFASGVVAQSHPTGIPVLSSRASAPYSLYLDFGGFNFAGTWGGASSPSGTPGNTSAYLGVTTSFNAAQQAKITEIWARVAEKYSEFNVNVTTVDPAAGHASNDSQRQAYYDSISQMMHTVVGGNGGWTGGGGISFIGTTQSSFTTADNSGAGAGYHTNFVFSDQSASLQFAAEASAHENGHGLGLWHQSDYTAGGTLVNQYSTNNGATGNGSYAPIMGDSYTVQRGTWRVGNSLGPVGEQNQNDATVIQANANMGNFIDDGIGHSLATASLLPLTGSNVNNTQAKGVIVPKDNANPTPIGSANYVSDFFKFHTNGGAVTLTATDGSQNITPGTADPGATLDSNLFILDSSGNLVATATRDTSTMFETFSGSLASGDYYAQISSIGGYTSTFDTSAKYYSMGSYFLTGSGFAAVPEPATLLALTAGLGLIGRRRRKKA